MLGREAGWLVANAEQPIAESARVEALRAVRARSTGLPLAYILGQWSFFGYEFEINADVLVPRPETEHLVEAALDFLKRHSRNEAVPLRVLDVGTGSGAIACTIAAECPQAIIDATDLSAAALAVAKRNASALGVRERCTFWLGDLATPVRGKRYDCVIANLPYVPSADVPRVPEPAGYEPRNAIDGGADGLVTYRRLLPQLSPLLCSGALVLLEAAPPTIAGLLTVARAQFPNASLEIGRDYGARERFVAIRQACAGEILNKTIP